VLDKVGEYLEASVRLVLVIDPGRARTASYRSLTDVTRVDIDGFLDCADVVPGFRVSLREILE
jgi:hypothetical protein